MTTRILSFDVGVRNLAYCVLEIAGGSDSFSSRVSIAEWDVLDIGGDVRDCEKCCARLSRLLRETFGTTREDVVLIERQPRGRNLMMMTVQVGLAMFFNYKDHDTSSRKVHFMNAYHKLDLPSFLRPGENQPLTTDPSSNDHGAKETNAKQQKRSRSRKDSASRRQQYKKNKADAIASCRHILENVLGDYANLALLDAYPKKDDLCDSFLQASHYVCKNMRVSH